ncbi:acyl carrier protein [Nitrosopumilus sp.]|uniref:acyl carrier protein n=1 Tax=Nitrosopumilus sp. TaxID=2024843 RepID=UPI003D0AE32B
MTQNKLYEIISRVFNIPEGEINEQSNPETIERWDSFTGYVLLDEIESTFNISIGMEEALEIKNVGDFKKILVEKGINFE